MIMSAPPYTLVSFQAHPDDEALPLWLPRPLARRVLGREWFREVGRAGGGTPLDDIFASLRNGTPHGVRHETKPDAATPTGQTGQLPPGRPPRPMSRSTATANPRSGFMCNSHGRWRSA